jgi:hypothetical protein
VAAVEGTHVLGEEAVAQLTGGGQPRIDEPQLHVIKTEAGQSLAGLVAGAAAPAARQPEPPTRWLHTCQCVAESAEHSLKSSNYCCEADTLWGR